jgi:hypothetical protein
VDHESVAHARAGGDDREVVDAAPLAEPVLGLDQRHDVVLHDDR